MTRISSPTRPSYHRNNASGTRSWPSEGASGGRSGSFHMPWAPMGFWGAWRARTDGVVRRASSWQSSPLSYEDDAPYQWSAHIAAARAAGLGTAIEAVRTGGDGSHLDDDELDVMSCAVSYAARSRASVGLPDGKAWRGG